MSELLQQVEAAVNQRLLLPRLAKVLVAVSGGADSLVLLHLLNALAAKQRWQLSLAHFNHQLRGRASLADEQLVRRTAAKLSLPFFCERGAVVELARRSKISVEMAARKLRHEFLARTARARKISTIALAHHADDQVELFFLRLLRGAGGEGLGGMKWRSPSPADPKISLIRPLLNCSKAELLAYAGEHQLRFREDATNAASDFLRNRIRNELLPLLEKHYQPGLAKTVLRVMEITGAEAEYASESARQWLENPSAGCFERLPVAVQRKGLQRQLTQLGEVSDFDLIEQLRKVAGKSVCVRPDQTLARDAAGIVNRCDSLKPQFNPGGHTLKISGRSGRMEFAGRLFRWRVTAQRRFRRPFPQDGVEYFDAATLGGEVHVRHWRAGDRFQPVGMKSAVKLQDLFVNAKIPAAQRRKLVLATTAAGEIVWVEGLRIGEKFKLTPATKRVLVWKWAEIPV